MAKLRKKDENHKKFREILQNSLHAYIKSPENTINKATLKK